MQSVLREIVISSIAVGAAFGVVDLLRWSLDLPAPQIPILPIIAAAVVMARVASSVWLNKLLNSPGRKS
ncbi:MAG: hypothetical protein ABL973_16900 [Micropepsaceae bacterium]